MSVSGSPVACFPDYLTCPPVVRGLLCLLPAAGGLGGASGNWSDQQPELQRAGGARYSQHPRRAARVRHCTPISRQKKNREGYYFVCL